MQKASSEGKASMLMLAACRGVARKWVGAAGGQGPVQIGSCAVDVRGLFWGSVGVGGGGDVEARAGWSGTYGNGVGSRDQRFEAGCE